ncbi:MAG TPA: carbohydrate ABC transporter permease [Candidatus Dormibacteraeota bacterium]
MRLLRPLILAPMLAISLAPIFWMTVQAFKAESDALATGNPWWPDHPTLANFVTLFTEPQFVGWILNTAGVTVATALIGVCASLLAGYALAYLGLPHSRSLVLVFFGTYLLPQSVLFIPLLRLLAELHLLNTPWALVATYPSLVIPFGTWVMWTFFRRLPRDLVDSALADGAGLLEVLRDVLLPVAWPALGTVAVYAVAVAFNDYLYTTTFIQETSGQTLWGALGALVSADISNPGESFAAAVLVATPVAVLCAMFAESFARGIGAGVIET